MMPKQKLPQSAPVTGGDASCLRIEALSVVRGQRLVIDRLSHAQEAGAYCLLTGANGAGKSTLLRTIAGRLPAESGHIHCDLPRIYIGHADGLAGAISGRKNLQSWAAINDIDVTDTELDEALDGFDAGAFADMPIQLLSRGQRRRLALARLLLAPQHSLWLLDEPNAGLDVNSQAQLETAINNHLAAGGTVISATHNAAAASTATIFLALGS